VTSVTLDFGGQILRWAADESKQTITVAHPKDRSRQSAELVLGNGSVATTGNGEQPRPHIYDPRNGKLAEDFGSVTVLASTALQADCLSTGLFVLGVEVGKTVAAEMRGVEAHFVTSDEASMLSTKRVFAASTKEERFLVETGRGYE
jgi:thiamine biosynthesis lipoprotein